MSGFRGRGRGNFRHFKEVPCVIFPEIEGLGTCGGVKKDLQFALRYNRLQKYWNASPNFFGKDDGGSNKAQKRGIERYTDKRLGKAKPKSHLSDFVIIEPDYFPAELCRGEKKEKHDKRVRWNPDSDLKRLDILEKREKNQGDSVAEKEGEEGEEEDDDKIEESEEESSDDIGDYIQNIDFDDDDDDFNKPEDNDDEGGVFY